jgi:hypothetical protein
MYKLYVDECDKINVTLDIHRSTHAENMDVLSEFKTLLFFGGGGCHELNLVGYRNLQPPSSRYGPFVDSISSFFLYLHVR